MMTRNKQLTFGLIIVAILWSCVIGSRVLGSYKVTPQEEQFVLATKTAQPTPTSSPSPSTTPIIKPIAKKTNTPEPTIVPPPQTTIANPISTVISVATATPIPTPVPTSISLPTSNTVTDIFKQAEDDLDKKQQQCAEWTIQRDAQLAPYKQKADAAKQIYDAAIAEIDNDNTKTVDQKARAKTSDRVNKLLTAYYDAEDAYLAVYKALGSCPYY